MLIAVLSWLQWFPYCGFIISFGRCVRPCMAPSSGQIASQNPKQDWSICPGFNFKYCYICVTLLTSREKLGKDMPVFMGVGKPK